MVAGSGLRVPVLPSDLGAGLCFVLRLGRWCRIWFRLGLGLGRLASPWTVRLFPSLVGPLGRAWHQHQHYQHQHHQPQWLCSAAWRHAIFEREPGAA